MRSLLTALFVLTACARLAGQAPESPRIPILFDTALGSDLDQGFALALMLASPEFDPRGVTTVCADANVRALMACRFLTMTGRRAIPVAAGAGPQPARPITPNGQYRYYYHPDVLFNRTTRPAKESAVEFLYNRLKAQPGKITIVAAGPLTNIARLIADKPDSKAWIKRIVVVGGSIQEPAPEANLRADIDAARTVFASGVPLVVVPREVTAKLLLDDDGLRRVFAPVTTLSLQLETLHQLADEKNPGLAAVLAVALCLDVRFASFEDLAIEIDKEGVTRVTKGKPNARVATSVRAGDFLKWYVDRMASCVSPAKQPSKLIAAGGFPNRVHVAEDYENDLERFWWMSGKDETKNTPPGSRRVCRGTLTHDYDDLLGNPKAMHTAVIFNPVPGPPMGKNPRLSFRYFLKGTDRLCVQIYSLSNGYHRQLYLTGLPQGRWESGTVDMTATRRPDGTGGPLSEHERIDDIQFYAEPTAELLIDDVLLFDAAAPGEKRPFPKHIHFTATFDTGVAGKHWLGNFDVVPDKGYFWRAAKSVDNAERGFPWIRLQLRGERAMGDATQLTFRYRLTGANSLQAVLVNRTAQTEHVVDVQELKQDMWDEATVDFKGPKLGDRVDELHWLLPRGAELLLDDVTLYVPGR